MECNSVTTLQTTVNVPLRGAKRKDIPNEPLPLPACCSGNDGSWPPKPYSPKTFREPHSNFLRKSFPKDFPFLINLQFTRQQVNNNF